MVNNSDISDANDPNAQFRAKVDAALNTVRSLVCSDRQIDYGDPRAMHTLIGMAWAKWQDGSNDPAHIVALKMAELKLCRLSHDQTKEDSYFDAMAYILLAYLMRPSKPAQSTQSKSTTTHIDWGQS